MRVRRPLILAGLLLSACAHESAGPAAPSECPYADANDGTQSYAILCQDPVANRVKVKHILIGWRELATPDHPVDPRAAERSYPEAQALARELLQRLNAGAPIEPLMDEHSEDPGSNHSGRAYDASPDAALVSGFKSLSLRLQPHQAGIVKTAFGLHIIQRVE